MYHRDLTPVEAPERRGQDLLKRPSETGARISKRQENILLYGLAVNAQSRCQTMEELLGMIRGCEMDSAGDSVTEFAESYNVRWTGGIYTAAVLWAATV